LVKPPNSFAVSRLPLAAPAHKRQEEFLRTEMAVNLGHNRKYSVDADSRRRTEYRGMVVTDLDGTLLGPDGALHEKDVKALTELGQNGFVRVIATGRSLFSLSKALPQDFPADYVVFSTGTGVAAFPSRRLLGSLKLEPAQVGIAVDVLQELQIDFSIQEPVPRNHRFQYWLSGRDNPDFARRLELYRNFCEPFTLTRKPITPAAQVIAILPPSEKAATVSLVRQRLSELTVVRATSPLDHQSIWTEIFPAGAGKGKAIARLAAGFGITVENILAIGNDFNDVDMLEQAGTGFMVDNAPDELKEIYPTVAANSRAAVAEAIDRWLQTGSGLQTAAPVVTDRSCCNPRNN
jgi:hypothetical protein